MTDLTFLEAILAQQGDERKDSMLAYADWLRDRGDNKLAYAWEWAARRGRFPSLGSGTYVWYLSGVNRGSACARLPFPVHACLARTMLNHGNGALVQRIPVAKETAAERRRSAAHWAFLMLGWALEELHAAVLLTPPGAPE